MEEIHATVMSVVCDGPPVNLAMSKHLGAKIEDSQPKTNLDGKGREKIHFMLDPPHMLKLIRYDFSYSCVVNLIMIQMDKSMYNVYWG